MKASEIRDMNLDEMHNKVSELREELFMISSFVGLCNFSNSNFSLLLSFSICMWSQNPFDVGFFKIAFTVPAIEENVLLLIFLSADAISCPCFIGCSIE